MYEFERMVYHCDAGEDGLLKLYSAVAMMMDCCQFQEYSETKFCEWLRSTDTAVFLASMQLDILRKPAFREKLKVKVVIYDCQSIYGFRRITMRDEQGKLCMISNAVGCFFNFSTMRAVRLPENIGDYLKYDQPAPGDEMECLPRKILLPTGNGIPLEPFKVMPSDLDLNRHLTAAKYFAVAEDRLPRDFHFDRVRVEYKNQAKPGSVIQPVMYRMDSGAVIVRLNDADQQLHASLEFSQRV